MSQENLVPNPSFEELDSCEQVFYFLDEGILNWYNAGWGSSVIYNSCVDDMFHDVPHNQFGWQIPYSGDGYAGILTYEAFTNSQDIFDSREYIQVELLQPLKANNTYAVSFYVSLADEYSTCASNGLGAAFSDSPISSSVPFGLINYDAQLVENVVITDSINWKQINGYYKANGGERFITIGNFQTDSETELICGADVSDVKIAFYYIDEVSLRLYGVDYLTLIPNVVSMNSDGINDFFEIKTTGYTGLNINVFNRWGKKVFTSNSIDFSWNGENQRAGVYYYVIELTRIDGLKDIEKGSVELIR